MHFKSALAASVALCFATPALADIDNTGTDTGNVAQFGAADTATYGNTFTTGAGDTSIGNFSMFLRNRYDGSGTLDLRGYIATWDGSKAGSILYSSATQTMNAAGTLQEFAFTPGIAVSANTQYVAFLSVSELAPQSQSTFSMPVAGNSIAGGRFVFMNNGTNFGDLTTQNWSQGFLGDNDVWLKVGFGSGAVPEPSTWALLILGFGMVGAGMRRRSQNVSVRFA